MHVDRVELFSLTEIDPMVQIDRPSARTVVDSMELIDGERYDQLYLEGETPDGERVRVCLGGGHGGRVEFFVISEGLGETHYLVRPGVEPLDALTTVSTGGQETEVIITPLLRCSSM